MNDKSNSKLFFWGYSGVISTLCILTAIFSRILYILYVSYVGGDKIMVALMSRNFLRGNGLSIPEYFISNVDNVVYNKTPLWPPGYPLLLAGFLKLFNNNLFWASTIIDLIAGIALIFIVRACCRVLDFKKAAINIATITAGCFNYAFISSSQPTDLVTITLFFLGFCYTLKLLKDGSIYISRLIVTAFFLVLPSFFRYSYHLAILLVPLTILFTGYLQKDSLVIKKGRSLFFLCLSFIGILMIIQFLISGSFYYVLPTEKGLYFNYLLHWAPFIPLSFISSDFIYTKIFAGNLNYQNFYSLLEAMNMACLAALILFIFLLVFKFKSFCHLTLFRWFVMIGAVVSAAIIFLLVYVTVTNKEQVFHGVPWSYIQEPRYFAFIFIYLQIAFIGWSFSGKKIPFKNHFLRVLKFVFILLLSLEIIHSIYFNFLLPFNYKKYKQQHYWETRMKFIEKTIVDLIINNSGKELIVAAYTHPAAPQIAGFYGQKGIVDSKNLNYMLPKVKRPGLLLLHLTEDEMPLFKEFFKKTNAVIYAKNDYDNFYLLELTPANK